MLYEGIEGNKIMVETFFEEIKEKILKNEFSNKKDILKGNDDNLISYAALNLK